MENNTGREMLSAAVSEKEWKKVPVNIAKKLEKYIGDKFDELITARALLETKHYNASQSLADIETRYETTKKTGEELSAKLHNANATIEELEKQLSNATSEIAKWQATCNRLEIDVAELRRIRDQIDDERDKLERSLERRTAEVERQQAEMKTLMKQLEEAVSAKCEVLAKISEVESMKVTLEYKEKRIEQDRELFTGHIDQLTRDLEAKTEELLNMRRDTTSRCVQLEIKLTEKVNMLNAANTRIESLNEINQNLVAKCEEMNKQMTEEREMYNNNLEAFQKETSVQKKIADLYKEQIDDNEKLIQELADGTTDLKKQLDQAIEKYGDLETKFKESQLANEEIVAKKTEYIAMLQKELETANELVSKSSGRTADDTFSSPLTKLKSGMTMTEIYAKYVEVSENLTQEKTENQRLQSYIHSIIQELEEKAPLIAKQKENYESALDNIAEMEKYIQNMTNEMQQIRDTMSDCKRNESRVVRENERLKQENADLGRQVCYLLREVEHSRVGSSSTSTDQDLSDSTASADIISKRLVTFSDISELQSTNQRLLACVRELSAKQESAESLDLNAIAAMRSQLEQLKETNEDLLQQQDKNSQLIKTLMDQRDTYRHMHQRVLKGADAKETSVIEEEGEKDESTSRTNDLEKELDKIKKELQFQKEEYETYKREKAAHEKIILEQSDKLRNDLQEIMMQNAKLVSKCKTLSESLDIQKNNADHYKSQIQQLEERNKICSESIVKHESIYSFMNERVMQSEGRLAKAEVALAALQKDNASLKESESRLRIERDNLKYECTNMTKMHTNIELIKSALERTEAESKIKLEETLQEAHRECFALRRRLQEEQDNFRALSAELERKTATAVQRMEEEKSVADRLRTELNETREDLATKSAQIEDLSKKLKTSIFSDIEGSIEQRRIREFEQLLASAQSEAESLRQKLKISKEAVEQHANVAQAAETQLSDVQAQLERETQQFNKTISEQANKIAELEEKCSELQGELALFNDGQVSVSTGLQGKIHKLEIQHNVVANELTETKQQLEQARTQIKELNEALGAAESKYSNEIALHSADLITLRTVKEELQTLQSTVNDLKLARDKANEALEETNSNWQQREAHLVQAKQDLETRLNEMDKHNSVLLNQIQDMNVQLTLLHNRVSESTSQNTSLGDVSLNRSLNEDDVKSSEQLLKIVKFLRQEKDIAINKCEILESEHDRIKTQYELLKKQYDDAKELLEADRQNNEVALMTSAKQAEILRKVETLNAITDSNRSLRLERDSLLQQLTTLKERINVLEDKLAPMEEQTKELQKKGEALQNENITLRGEATRWRQRANMLIEKSNRTSPEDWKKLQNERETLAKQIVIERANVTKLTEENGGLKREKQTLLEQLKVMRMQQDSQKEELDRMASDLSQLQSQVSAVSTELTECKNQNVQSNEENRSLTESLSAKDAALTELKVSFEQIRRIAKKYKTQAAQQQKEIDELKAQLESEPEKRQEEEAAKNVQIEERVSQLEQEHSSRLSELNQQVQAKSAEADANRREIDQLKENLKASHEKEERWKVLLKTAKERIMNLQEVNNSLKSQIQKLGGDGANANAGEGSSSSSSSSSQAPNNDSDRKDEVIAEKQQEIESLNQKLNQLQRQLGSMQHHQGSKPSTSSEKDKTTTEPPTANIKPMAGHSTQSQQTQSVAVQPFRSAGETPLASIRPMSMQAVRTVAVLPTSQTSSPSTVMVPPQQQVHTTGGTSGTSSTSSSSSSSGASSGIEAMSSSPTSSHTDYVPATSSASSAMVGQRHAASVPPTQSSQDVSDEDADRQMQQTSAHQAHQAGVALVMPRVEQTQEQGTSSGGSSNTVTTSQAGHKRPREADTENEEQGSSSSSKTQQQAKRTRKVETSSTSTVDGGSAVSESGLEVEYQVPTSSQRDHEEDVVVVESDDEGPDEGDGDDYNISYDPDTQDHEVDISVGNEVEVEDSSDMPNQSERQDGDGMMMPADAEVADARRGDAEELEEEEEAMQPEATSSGANVSTSVAMTLPSFSRSRPVPPLMSSRQQQQQAQQNQQQQNHLVLSHGLEEGGDDGIVPSTPTLFVARRSDGFGEAVSSPHVPTSGRFTFNESAASGSGGMGATNDILPEQTLEMQSDDNSTGRSVPNTPLQTSPHESTSGPSGGGIGNDEQSHQRRNDDDDVQMVDDDDDCMRPPVAVAGTSAESADDPDDVQENDDGVSSEGEKAPHTEGDGVEEEEGREAEASPSSFIHQSVQPSISTSPQQSRVLRPRSSIRGIARSPIVWGGDHQHIPQSRIMTSRGGRGMLPHTLSARSSNRRRGGGRPQRSPYGRY